MMKDTSMEWMDEVDMKTVQMSLALLFSIAIWRFWLLSTNQICMDEREWRF